MFLALVAVSVLVSAAAVFPLWFAAVHWTQVFTWGVMAFLLAGAAAYLVLRTVRASREAGTNWGWKLGRFFVRVATVVVFGFLLYGIIWLFNHHLYLVAVSALLLYVLLLGVVKYGKWRFSFWEK